MDRRRTVPWVRRARNDIVRILIGVKAAFVASKCRRRIGKRRRRRRTFKTVRPSIADQINYPGRAGVRADPGYESRVVYECNFG